MYPIKRTPEQGHTKRCLAKALITSIENWKDAYDIDDHDFRIAAQRNVALEEADEWLAVGMTECVCPD